MDFNKINWALKQSSVGDQLSPKDEKQHTIRSVSSVWTADRRCYSVRQGHLGKASTEEAIDAFLVHWTHRVQPHPIVDKLTMELNSPFQNIFDMEQLKAKYTFYSIKFYIIAKISLFF